MARRASGKSTSREAEHLILRVLAKRLIGVFSGAKKVNVAPPGLPGAIQDFEGGFHES
jgi:hypothetical protein